MPNTAKKSDLLEHVESISRNIENLTFEKNDDGEDLTAFDYLGNALDIEWTLDSKRQLLGARILVAWGGPNIWVDTRHNKVEGYWWGDYAEASYIDNFGLCDAVQELWDCQ